MNSCGSESLVSPFGDSVGGEPSWDGAKPRCDVERKKTRCDKDLAWQATAITVGIFVVFELVIVFCRQMTLHIQNNPAISSGWTRGVNFQQSTMSTYMSTM